MIHVSEADPNRNRLEGPASSAGPRATDAFSLLADQTRLSILLTLWEEQKPLAKDNTVQFSRLFDRVDYDDRGSFSYHLKQLEGQFITQHGERGGYKLLVPGLKLVRSVVAGTGVTDATLEPTEIDQPCPLCEARTEISYRDGVVFLCCTECEGMAPGKAAVDAVLNAIYFEPAGVANRTPEELHAASMASVMNQTRSLFDGVCPTCSGPVDGRLECCPDHEPKGGCERCGLRFGTLARFQCRVCKFFGGGNLKKVGLCHPEMRSFYEDHGVSTQIRAGDFESARRVYDLLYDYSVECLSEGPLRATVSASVYGDTIRLTFDDRVTVVDVSR